MSIAISTIQNLVGQYPLGLMTAHKWYVDAPTNTNPIFQGNGYFAGGDLPFGVLYELHSLPADTPFKWHDSIVFPELWGHIVNLAPISGYDSAVVVEEFFVNRPRGLFRFNEPKTSDIVVETIGGVFLQLWGLYIDIPLITPTQPTWHQTGSTPYAPDNYAPATVYTGLSGAGTVVMGQGSIGAQINVTTIPGATGEEAGEPIERFNLGWINWGDGFSFRSREWITSDAFQTFPTVPAFAPALGYSLSPGVIISVTELRSLQQLGT
jgi:hypothetical protein